MSKTTTTVIRVIFLALFLFLIAQGKMVLWLALYGASLLVALLFGRVYCGYVCPMNTCMVPAEWISKKAGMQAKQSPRWLQNNYLPWALLALSLATMFLSKRFLKMNLPVLLIWLGISVLITLRYHPSLFHNYICPFGAPQKLFGKFAKKSKVVDEPACIGCKRCEKVCPSEAVAVGPETKKALIDKSICHQCVNCKEVCPTNAILYK